MASEQDTKWGANVAAGAVLPVIIHLLPTLLLLLHSPYLPNLSTQLSHVSQHASCHWAAWADGSSRHIAFVGPGYQRGCCLLCKKKMVLVEGTAHTCTQQRPHWLFRMLCLRPGPVEFRQLHVDPPRVFLKGGGGCGGDPLPPGDPELSEAPKAPNKFFGLN